MDSEAFKLKPASKSAGFRMDGYWVWCGSAIKAEDGRYHMFASRWPKHFAFHPGWLTDSEVVRAVSDSPLGPFEFQEIVLPRRGAEYWDGCMTHNPRIVKCGGLYVLFYTGTTYPFKPVEPGEPCGNLDPRTVVARSNKRTGIAVSESINGPWRRFDAPILPAKPGTFYSFLTSNATPVVHPDGSLYVMFKSRRYNGYLHSDMMIGVAEAKSWDSKFEVLTDEPVFGPGRFGEIEDPFVWLAPDGSYRMIAKDMSGSICGEKFAGIIAQSHDGVSWRPCANPKSYSKTVLWDDGTTQDFALFERPCLLIEAGRPKFLYAAVADRFPYAEPGASTWSQAFEVE